MGKYDFLGPDLIKAIARTRQPVTPLQNIAEWMKGYDILKYDRNSHLFMTKEDKALLLLWYRNLEAVELGTLYIKPEYRGGAVLDEVFNDLFKVCDYKKLIVVGTADRFEIAECDQHLMFTTQFWNNPHTQFKQTEPIAKECNDKWLSRLITQYGFIQPKIEEDKYFVKRVPKANS